MLNSLIFRHVQNKVYFILLILIKNYYIITSDICLSLKNFTERLFVHKREQARIVIILHKTGKLPPVQRNHPLCIPLKILSNITLFVHVFSSILILRFLSFLLNDYYIINLAKQMTSTVYRNQIHYIQLTQEACWSTRYTLENSCNKRKYNYLVIHTRLIEIVHTFIYSYFRNFFRNF